MSLAVLLNMLASFFTTVGRRLVGRPRVRSWPFMFEVGVGLLRGLVLLGLIAARDGGVPRPAAAAMISPWVDLRCEGASFEENESYDWGTAEVLRAQAKLAAREHALDAPAISPRFADLSGLPALLVHVGDKEMVRDPVLDAVGALEAQGNAVTLERYDDMVHDFRLLAEFHPVAQEATESIAEFLSARCA